MNDYEKKTRHVRSNTERATDGKGGALGCLRCLRNGNYRTCPVDARDDPVVYEVYSFVRKLKLLI